MAWSVVVVGSASRLPAWSVFELSGNRRQFHSGIYHPILLESPAHLPLSLALHVHHHLYHHVSTGSDHRNHHQELRLRSRPFRRPPLARSFICYCCGSSSSPSSHPSSSTKSVGVVVGKVAVDDKTKKDHADDKVEGKDNDNAEKEPLPLRVAVSGVTQLLRVFSKINDRSSSKSARGGNTSSSSSIDRSGTTRGRDRNNSSESSSSLSSSALIPAEAEEEEEGGNDWSSGPRSPVDILREDYAKSYFLTGDFTDALYSESCYFADPTVRFSGRDLYKRNLKLLVPFYEDPSLTLDDIAEVVDDDYDDGESKLILASWRLRVYLKLPWKPFVAVDGATRYSLDADGKIIKHVESWNVSGIQAIGQLFRPSERAFWRKGAKGS